MAGVLTVLMLGGLVSTLTWVDRRPLEPAGLPAALTRGIAALSAAEIGSAGVNPLRVGTARRRWTPRIAAGEDHPERGEFRMLPLAGYGQRAGRPSVGVHDELWVKAVAVANQASTGVIVAADALIIPREVAEVALERIREGCGLDRSSVYFGATHTHCGPGGWGEGWVGEAFAGGFQPGVRVWMAQQLALAVCDAVTNLAPGSFAGGSFEAPELVRNRLVGDGGSVDPEFSLLCFRGVHGPAVVIGSFSAHATVLGGSTMEFSGDYPGCWARSVEARTGGMALFLAAGVGSHAPRPPGTGWEGAEAMGDRLARRTWTVLEGMAFTNRAALRMQTLRLDLPELQARLTDSVRLRPWLARRVLPVSSTTWLQALRLGNHVWLSTPCDYSGELALEIKALARARGLQANVTSFNGDYVGYVVPAKYYSLNTYETRTMSFFGPQLPDYFATGLRELLVLAGEGIPPR